MSDTWNFVAGTVGGQTKQGELVIKAVMKDYISQEPPPNKPLLLRPRVTITHVEQVVGEVLAEAEQ